MRLECSDAEQEEAVWGGLLCVARVEYAAGPRAHLFAGGLGGGCLYVS